MFLFQLRQQSPKTGLPDLNAHESDIGKRVQNISSWVREQIAPLQHTEKKQAVYDAVSNLEACGKKFSSSTPEQHGRFFAELQQGITRLTNALSDAHVPNEKKGESVFEKVYSGNFDSYLWQTSSMAYNGISKLAEGQRMGKLGEELWLNSQVSAHNEQIEVMKKEVASKIKKEIDDNKFFAPSTTNVVSVGKYGKRSSSDSPQIKELAETYKQLDASLLGVTLKKVNQPTISDANSPHYREEPQLSVDLQSNIISSTPPTKLASIGSNLLDFIPFKNAVFNITDGMLMIFQKEGDSYKGVGLVMLGVAEALVDYAFTRGVFTPKTLAAGKVGAKEWNQALKQGLEEGVFKFENNRLVVSGINGAKEYTSQIGKNTFKFKNVGGRVVLESQGKTAGINITNDAFKQLTKVNSVFSEITRNTALVKSNGEAVDAFKKSVVAHLQKSNLHSDAVEQIGGFVDRMAQGESFESVIKSGLSISGEKYEISFVNNQFRVIGRHSNSVTESIDQVLKALKTNTPKFESIAKSNAEAFSTLQKLGAQKFETPLLSGTSWGWESPRTYSRLGNKTPITSLKAEGDLGKVINEAFIKNEFKTGTYAIDGVDCVVKKITIGKEEFLAAEFNGKVYTVKPGKADKILKALNSGDKEGAIKLVNNNIKIDQAETLLSNVGKAVNTGKTKLGLGEKVNLVDEETAKTSLKDMAKGTILGRLPEKYGGRSLLEKYGGNIPLEMQGKQKGFEPFLLTAKGFEKFMAKPPRVPALWLPVKSGSTGLGIIYIPETAGRFLLDLGADVIAGPTEFLKYLGTKDAGKLKDFFQKAWANVLAGHPSSLTLPYVGEKLGSQYFIYNTNEGQSMKWLESLFSKTEGLQETKTTTAKTEETKTVEVKNQGSFGSPKSAESIAMDWVIGRGSGNEFAANVSVLSAKNGGNPVQAAKDAIGKLLSMGLDETKTREEINGMLEIQKTVDISSFSNEQMNTLRLLISKGFSHEFTVKVNAVSNNHEWDALRAATYVADQLGVMVDESKSNAEITIAITIAFGLVE
ncbi:MAG: hypothetical protein WCT52_05120 [Candidatus Micrarchaeia archaeon]